MYFTSNDRSQHTFDHQPELDSLELKNTKVLIMVLVGNQNNYIILKLSHYILFSWVAQNFPKNRLGIKFDKGSLALEQNNDLSKIVNAYIVYDIDTWPRNLTKNIKFKNCLFGATSILKNNDKEKYVCSGYRITFDSAGSWSFDNDTARNVIIFGVDNNSSFHSDNYKNKFLVLNEGPPFGINGNFG